MNADPSNSKIRGGKSVDTWNDPTAGFSVATTPADAPAVNTGTGAPAAIAGQPLSALAPYLDTVTSTVTSLSWVWLLAIAGAAWWAWKKGYVHKFISKI